MIRVFGIDPSTAHIYFAEIEVFPAFTRAGHISRYIDRGSVDRAGILVRLRACASSTLIAVEKPERVHRAAAGRHLLKTSDTAGLIAGMAETLGLACTAYEASFVRRRLLGTKRVGNRFAGAWADRDVAREIYRLVDGWPPPSLPGKRASKADERDAAAVALVAGGRWLEEQRMAATVAGRTTRAARGRRPA